MGGQKPSHPENDVWLQEAPPATRQRSHSATRSHQTGHGHVLHVAVPGAHVHDGTACHMRHWPWPATGATQGELVSEGFRPVEQLSCRQRAAGDQHGKMHRLCEPSLRMFVEPRITIFGFEIVKRRPRTPAGNVSCNSPSVRMLICSRTPVLPDHAARQHRCPDCARSPGRTDCCTYR